MASNLEVGMKLHAAYSDGEFYPAVVEAISSSQKRAQAPVKVSYVGYDESAWKSISELKSKQLPKAEAKAKAKAKAKATAPDYSGLEKGMQVQAEADGKYYLAEVVAVAKAKKTVKVHWAGYTSASDEWVSGDRIRSKALKPTQLPRVAICFCGERRAFRDPLEGPSTYHQIKKLVAAVGPADVFCSIFEGKDEGHEEAEKKSMEFCMKELSPKRMEIRPDIDPDSDRKLMSELGKHPNISVLQAAYPKKDVAEAGKQAMTNGFIFWGIRHAHRLMVKEEKARGMQYDIVLRVRYDLTFQRFFWTEQGAAKVQTDPSKYGMATAPAPNSMVTAEQLTCFQEKVPEDSDKKVHKMVESGDLMEVDTVSDVQKLVKALDSTRKIVMVPLIHNWGGCNDQFGFGSRTGMEVYADAFRRYNALVKQGVKLMNEEGVGQEALKTGLIEPLQTEKCLEKTLLLQGIEPSRKKQVTARILRLNGDVSTQ